MQARSSVWIAAVVLAPFCACEANAQCQKGAASAPYIGAADMRRIDEAAAHLPRVEKGRIAESVGAPVPAGIKRAAVPDAVKQVLPQYAQAGYSAFRVGGKLAIADKEGTLSYLMPLGEAPAPGNCP